VSRIQRENGDLVAEDHGRSTRDEARVPGWETNNRRIALSHYLAAVRAGERRRK
jgi:hypothetical protein